MSVYAYLRVSTDRQDVANQKFGILEYANSLELGPIKFLEDSVSGRQPWQKRQLGHLLFNLANSGDVVIFAEIARMSRSTLQVLEVLEYCTQNQIVVHVAKQKMILDDSMPSRITATVLGLAAEIERELISQRTKESLAKAKADGVKLGRPKGPAQYLKLDEHEEMIKDYLSRGISKASIAKIIKCSPTTLYYWLKCRKVKVKRRDGH
jgi:DNA invertase Pin-like site-specific DNA recombinase